MALPQSLALAFAQLADRRVIALLFKSAMLTIVIVAALAVFGFWLMTNGLASWSWTRDVPLVEAAGAVVAMVAAILSAWLVWRLVAMAVLQFYADDVIALVEDRFYPSLKPKDLPMRVQMQQAARGAIRALVANLVAAPFALALLITGVGTAILFGAVNAWLLGRELRDMVWLRHASDLRSAPVNGVTRFMLGAVVVGMLSVPFANLLAPFVGAAAATHLVHRAAARRQENA